MQEQNARIGINGVSSYVVPEKSVKNDADSSFSEDGGMTNSLTSATEEQFIGAMADAGVAHRSNTEFTAQMLRELKQSVERVRALEGETKDKREKALVAIGAVYQLAKVAMVV